MIKILKEKYVDTLEIWNVGKSQKDMVEFFTNPDSKEFRDVLSEYPNGARGLILKNGDLLVWKGDIIHQNVLFALYDNNIKVSTQYSYNVEISPQKVITLGGNVDIADKEDLEKLNKRVALCLKKNSSFTFESGY